MRLTRRHDVIDLVGVSGAVRLDRTTAKLTARLRPGDIAVVDHLDLDAASAEALVACRVAAVVNASPSTSGRYPNLGPAVLVGAGIPLLDAVGVGVFDEVREGRVARLTHNQLWVGDRQVATGMLVWNLLAARGRGWPAGVIAALIFLLPTVALWRAKPLFV